MTASFERPCFSQPWSAELLSWSATGGRICLHRDGEPVATIELARCAMGRIRLAYPVATHDVEVRVADVTSSEDLTAVLQAMVPVVREADPQCRKVVFVVDHSGSGHGTMSALAEIAAAETAGFRYVVDVDIADAELSLLVEEPEWVTAVDLDLDHVPGT